MSEYKLNDPTLIELESKLQVNSPSLSAVERQRLLYECAFAAGRSAALRATRVWQAVSAMAILIGVSLLLQMNLSSNPKTTEQTPGKTLPTEMSPATGMPLAPSGSGGQLPSPGLFPDLASTVATPRRINLDAWQIPDDGDDRLSQSLQRFQQMLPAEQAQTVIGLQTLSLR